MFLNIYFEIKKEMVIKTFYVKPIICSCCIRIVKDEMANSGINVVHIASGDVTLAYDEFQHSEESIVNVFNKNGFQVIVNQDKILVNKIKTAVIELVHFTDNMNSIIRNTDYLVEKLGYSIFYLASVFSKYETNTLDEFIEMHKIEKTKEYLKTGGLTIGEISYNLGYPNAIQLEERFAEITGISINRFIKNPQLGNMLLVEI